MGRPAQWCSLGTLLCCATAIKTTTHQHRVIGTTENHPSKRHGDPTILKVPEHHGEHWPSSQIRGLADVPPGIKISNWLFSRRLQEIPEMRQKVHENQVRAAYLEFLQSEEATGEEVYGNEMASAYISFLESQALVGDKVPHASLGEEKMREAYISFLETGAAAGSKSGPFDLGGLMDALGGMLPNFKATAPAVKYGGNFVKGKEQKEPMWKGFKEFRDAQGKPIKSEDGDDGGKQGKGGGGLEWFPPANWAGAYPGQYSKDPEHRVGWPNWVMQPKVCPEMCSYRGTCDFRTGECICNAGMAGNACDRTVAYTEPCIETSMLMEPPGGGTASGFHSYLETQKSYVYLFGGMYTPDCASNLMFYMDSKLMMWLPWPSEARCPRDPVDPEMHKMFARDRKMHWMRHSIARDYQLPMLEDSKSTYANMRYKAKASLACGPPGRYGHTFVSGPFNRLWMFGGDSPNFKGDKSGYHMLGDLWSYVPADSLWEQWSHPQGGAKPMGRIEHAALCVGMNMYIFGGRSKFRALNDLWAWNFNSYSWREITPMDGGRRPEPRFGPAISMALLPYEATFIMSGGADANFTVTDFHDPVLMEKDGTMDVWTFSWRTGWALLPCKTLGCPPPRWGHGMYTPELKTANSAKGIAFIGGGVDKGGSPLTDVYEFKMENMGLMDHGKCAAGCFSNVGSAPTGDPGPFVLSDVLFHDKMYRIGEWQKAVGIAQQKAFDARQEFDISTVPDSEEGAPESKFWTYRVSFGRVFDPPEPPPPCNVFVCTPWTRYFGMEVGGAVGTYEQAPGGMLKKRRGNVVADSLVAMDSEAEKEAEVEEEEMRSVSVLRTTAATALRSTEVH